MRVREPVVAPFEGDHVLIGPKEPDHLDRLFSRLDGLAGASSGSAETGDLVGVGAGP
jgi:hypothetical protein